MGSGGYGGASSAGAGAGAGFGGGLGAGGQGSGAMGLQQTQYGQQHVTKKRREFQSTTVDIDAIVPHDHTAVDESSFTAPAPLLEGSKKDNMYFHEGAGDDQEGEATGSVGGDGGAFAGMGQRRSTTRSGNGRRGRVQRRRQLQDQEPQAPPQAILGSAGAGFGGAPQGNQFHNDLRSASDRVAASNPPQAPEQIIALHASDYPQSMYKMNPLPMDAVHGAKNGTQEQQVISGGGQGRMVAGTGDGGGFIAGNTPSRRDPAQGSLGVPDATTTADGSAPRDDLLNRVAHITDTLDNLSRQFATADLNDNAVAQNAAAAAALHPSVPTSSVSVRTSHSSAHQASARAGGSAGGAIKFDTVDVPTSTDSSTSSAASRRAHGTSAMQQARPDAAAAATEEFDAAGAAIRQGYLRSGNLDLKGAPASTSEESAEPEQPKEQAPTAAAAPTSEKSTSDSKSAPGAVSAAAPAPAAVSTMKMEQRWYDPDEDDEMTTTDSIDTASRSAAREAAKKPAAAAAVKYDSAPTPAAVHAKSAADAEPVGTRWSDDKEQADFIQGLTRAKLQRTANEEESQEALGLLQASARSRLENLDQQDSASGRSSADQYAGVIQRAAAGRLEAVEQQQSQDAAAHASVIQKAAMGRIVSFEAEQADPAKAHASVLQNAAMARLMDSDSSCSSESGVEHASVIQKAARNRLGDSESDDVAAHAAVLQQAALTRLVDAEETAAMAVLDDAQALREAAAAKSRQEESEANLAATKIQANARGHKVRKGMARSNPSPQPVVEKAQATTFEHDDEDDEDNIRTSTSSVAPRV